MPVLIWLTMREIQIKGTGEAAKGNAKVISILIVWCMMFAGFIGVFTLEPKLGSEASVNNLVGFSRSNRTLYVGGNGSGNYTKIQDAIDAAADGDTVFVYNGTYYENIIVNKSISLVGENIENTTINGSGTGDVVLVTVTNTIIQGFKIVGSEDYIYKGFSYQNHNAGIEIDNVQNCEIINNNISSNYGDGIYVNNSLNITIMDNFFSLNNREAISIYRSSLISTNRNKFSNNKYGIELRKSDDNSVCNNIGYMNKGVSISLYESNNNYI